MILVHGHTSVFFVYFTPIYLNTFKCSWAHTLSFLFIVLLSILDLLLWCVLLSHQIVYRVCIWYLFLFVIFLSRDIYVVCNVWSSAAVIISFSVCPFISPLDSYRNVPSPPKCCLSILLIYWPRFILLSHFFYKDSPNFVFMCWMPSTLCHCSHLIGLIGLQHLLPLYRGADKSLARPDWKDNWKIAIFRPTRRSLLPWRPGWTDKLLNFLLAKVRVWSL